MPSDSLNKTRGGAGSDSASEAAATTASRVPPSLSNKQETENLKGGISRLKKDLEEVGHNRKLGRAQKKTLQRDLILAMSKMKIRLGILDDDLTSRMDAVAALEELTKTSPNDVHLWLALGKAYEASSYHSKEAGFLSAAGDAYRRAYELDSADPQTRLFLAERLLQDLRGEDNTSQAIRQSARIIGELLNSQFLMGLPAQVQIESNIGGLAPFVPNVGREITLNADELRDKAEYLRALAAFFVARKLERDRPLVMPDSLPAFSARTDALCAAAVKNLDSILERDYKTHGDAFTNHAALLLEAALAYRAYENTGAPEDLQDAELFFERGVTSLRHTDPHRADCYCIPLDPKSKAFDPRWLETGYPWEGERSNPSQVGPIQRKNGYRYHLFQADVYFGDVWLQLPIEVALRAPLAGIVLYRGFGFTSIEERGGTFLEDVSQGPQQSARRTRHSAEPAVMPSRTDAPKRNRITGYLPHYLLVHDAVLGDFTVSQDGAVFNPIHGLQAIEEIKKASGPGASLLAPEPDKFIRDTNGFLTTVGVDKAPGRTTEPLVTFQMRVPLDVDSTGLALRAILVGPDNAEIAMITAQSPRFSERRDFVREPADLGGRWIWRSLLRLPRDFVRGLSPIEGRPCRVVMQLMQNGSPIPTVQVVTGVNVRPFPANVFRLGDPNTPHFGLVTRGHSLTVLVHAYENMATPDSMQIRIPKEYEIHPGAATRNDDGSYTVFLPQGTGLVGQILRVFAADGPSGAPLFTKRSAFYISDSHGSWSGGRAQTQLAVEIPTGDLPIGQYLVVLTWNDAVSKSSSSVSTAFTVVDDSAPGSAKTGIGAGH